MKLFDETRTYTYPNGLALYVLPRPGSASLELQCAVRTGSIHEGEHSGCGLSHFLEHMLFQGCAGFPGRSGSEKIEKTGGSINAYTSYDRTVYYLRVPEKAKELAVDLLSSMVRFPELPEKRFAEEKDVILRECDLYFDSPAIKMFLTGFDALFGTHPARVPIIGHRPMIASVTRDMAAAYHTKRYTPNRCFFVAVGAVDPDWLYNKLGEKLGDWAMGSPYEPALPEIPDSPAPRQIETVFPDTGSPLALLLPPPPP
ncbi:MAG: insulinase family protein, partial [Lentisphaeria bacterium]|nr:insulinase family protein [Lentisphaeria bacterium]